ARISGARPLCRNSLIVEVYSWIEHRRSAVVIEAQNGSGGFLAGGARDVDHRPAPPGAELPRLGDFGGDRLAIDIGVEKRGGMLQHAVLADLRDALGACHEADHES